MAKYYDTPGIWQWLCGWQWYTRYMTMIIWLTMIHQVYDNDYVVDNDIIGVWQWLCICQAKRGQLTVELKGSNVYHDKKTPMSVMLRARCLFIMATSSWCLNGVNLKRFKACHRNRDLLIVKLKWLNKHFWKKTLVMYLNS